MRRLSSPPMPVVGRRLAALGENIRLARRRRRLTATLLAERAGMSRPTLRSIERGDAGVTLGAVANVLHSLGLERISRSSGATTSSVVGSKTRPSNRGVGAAHRRSTVAPERRAIEA